MLTMLGSPRRCCDGITRRETLKAGALSMLGGFGLADYLRAKEYANQRPGKAKNVIVLYLLGGAPTQDMWDLKPDAPSNIRTQFKPIPTSASGVQICELLPRAAKWMHKSAIVRSVNHQAGCHNPLPSYTGFERKLDSITVSKDSYPPSMGSVCEYMRDPSSPLPAYVYMPCYLGWGQAIRRPGPYAGILGKRCDPLFTECEPYVDNPPEKPYYAQVLRGEPRISNSALPKEITVDRLDTRRSLLDQIDAQRRTFDSSPQLTTYDRNQQLAWSILNRSKVGSAFSSAFDLADNDPKLLDRYGRSLFGASALVARKLVEAGVKFVNVTWACYWERCKLQYECWDTHKRNYGELTDYNLPQFDLTYSALMEDLDNRGLLDETLVVVMSEMGRTPNLNKNGGRDHWTMCYSVLLAGAGIRGGTIYGASDAHAAYVKDNPVSTGDICATIYHCLGIDPTGAVKDRGGRPVPLTHGGKPIHAILT